MSITPPILPSQSSNIDKNTQKYTETPAQIHTHLGFVNILTGGFSIIQANCIVMGYSTFMNSGYLENELITREMNDFNYSPPNSHMHTYTQTHAHSSDFST